MFTVGSKVIHPLHGLGTVDTIEHKNILGQAADFACISFQKDRLQIMVNLSKSNCLIRPLVGIEDIAKVYDHMQVSDSNLPTRASDRYNLNMNKMKSCDIMQLAEVIRDLTYLSKNHKLSPKEQQMLKLARKTMTAEFSFVTERDEETIETEIDEACRTEEEKSLAMAAAC